MVTLVVFLPVADDDDFFRSRLVSVLRKAEYRVLEAKDGWDAFYQINGGTRDKRLQPVPDLVILDDQTPGMTGREMVPLPVL